MSNRAFYSFSLSFFAGICAVSILDISLSLIAVMCYALSAISIALCVYNRRITYVLIIGASIAFLLGALRMESVGGGLHSLDSEVGKRFALEGLVCDEPQKKETTQRFCFTLDSNFDRVLVTTGRYPEYSYGDRLWIEGELTFPENFETYEGGPEFDYVSYLAKDGLRYTMFRPVIEKLGEGEGNPIMHMLFATKATFMRQIQALFLEPESSLLGGLLLGDRSALPRDIAEEFKKAGLVHILVLSGYNVTIVAESLMKAFAFLPRVFGQSAGALSIVLFALMTGASATTVRASIMALVVIVARFASRPYDATRALLVAALLMVVHNPAILAFDVSFQLSFLATLSLVYVAPLVSERLTMVTEKWGLREILSSTIATQIFVFPYLVYTMGQVSLVSFVTNLLVLPLVPFTMFLGFISSALGFVSQTLALPIAWMGSGLLSYILSLASFSSRVPFASIHMQTSAFALVCVYVIYALYLIRVWQRRNCSPRSAN